MLNWWRVWTLESFYCPISGATWNWTYLRPFDTKDLSIYNSLEKWKHSEAECSTQVFSDLTFNWKLSCLTENYPLSFLGSLLKGSHTGKPVFLHHCLHALIFLSDYLRKVAESYPAAYKWPSNAVNVVRWNKCSLKYPIGDLKIKTQSKYVAIREGSLAWLSQVTLIPLLYFWLHLNLINF